jgi:hypothetical protein
MVVSLFSSERVIVPWGTNKCKKCALKKEINFSENASELALSPPHKGR